jgi:hypothetical protein
MEDTERITLQINTVVVCSIKDTFTLLCMGLGNWGSFRVLKGNSNHAETTQG